MSNDPGYKKLIVWKNICELRREVYKTTQTFSKMEMRRISQMNDAARSVKQNLQEGYKASLPKYINAVKNYCIPSLAELHGDIEDCFEDKLINEEKFTYFDDLCKRTDYLLFRLKQGLLKKQKEQ